MIFGPKGQRTKESGRALTVSVLQNVSQLTASAIRTWMEFFSRRHRSSYDATDDSISNTACKPYQTE